MVILAIFLFILAIAIRIALVGVGSIILLMNVNDLFSYYANGWTPPDAWPFFWILIGLSIGLFPVTFNAKKG